MKEKEHKHHTLDIEKAITAYLSKRQRSVKEFLPDLKYGCRQKQEEKKQA